jgi:transcription elongation factor GreA-like protein
LVLLRYGGKKYGKKVMYEMLYGILDKNRQNCMQVLSIRLRDEFEKRTRVMMEDNLMCQQITQGGRVFSFGKADFQVLLVLITNYFLYHKDY